MEVLIRDLQVPVDLIVVWNGVIDRAYVPPLNETPRQEATAAVWRALGQAEPQSRESNRSLILGALGTWKTRREIAKETGVDEAGLGTYLGTMYRKGTIQRVKILNRGRGTAKYRYRRVA